MKRMCVVAILAVLGIAAWGNRASAQSVVYVDVGMSGIASETNGLSWETPFVDLQSALGVAASGDSIWVAQGVYKPGSSPADAFTPLGGRLHYGGFTNGMATLEERQPLQYLTILSGDINGDDGTNFANRIDNALNVIRSTGTTRSNIRIDGFVIRGGNADGVGAPNDTGGGAHFDLCPNLVIANCIFTDNSGKGSGAIRLRRSNNVEIQDCVFSGNRATDASSNFGSGAIGGNDEFAANAGYPANVRRCIFTGNTSAGLAGVTYDSSAAWDINFINCLMAGNTAGSNGGALYLRSGTNAMVNCTIALNDPLGITTRLTTNISVNTIIWSNGPGGAASVDVDRQNNGTLLAKFSDINHTVYNGINGTILADPKWGAGTQATWNAASIYYPTVGQTRLRRTTPSWAADAYKGMTINPDITQKRHFLICSNSTTEIYVWGDAQWIAASGDTFRIWDFRLGNGSPCIDTGTNGIVSDDVIKTSRPKGFATDMGAYESTATGTVAGVIYVNDNATGGNNGSAWEHAYTNLQDALAAASGDNNNQIWVAAGTYRPGSGTLATFYLTSRVPIYGGFAGTEASLLQRNVAANPTILSGDGDNNDTANFANRANNAAHVVSDLYTKNVRLDGFVIRGGNATGVDAAGYGGGLYCEGSTNLVVANCTFVDNSAVGGGAIYLNEPKSDWVTISDCVFSGNRATEQDNDVGGGAITGARQATAPGYLLVERCVFAGNRAPNSIGGVYAMHNTQPLVSRFVNCLAVGNQSGYTNAIDITGPQGGAFYLRSTNATLLNCTIGLNQPYAMTLRNINATVQNSILWGNTTSEILPLAPSSVSASYSDIDEPGYEGVSGSIRQDPQWGAGTNGTSSGVSYSSATGRSTLTVAGSPWAAGAFVNRAVNPNTAQNLQFWIITNSVNQLTVWGDLQAVASVGNPFRVYDYHLQSSSPCIDSASLLVAPATDLEQFVRPVGIFADIGSYEFGGSALFTNGVVYVDRDATGLNDGTSWTNAFTSLSAALAAAPGGREIWVAEGTYKPGATTNDAFQLKANVAVYGGFAGTENTLGERNWRDRPTYLSGDLLGDDGTEDLSASSLHRGDNSRHVVVGVDASTLDGFIIAGGYASATDEANQQAYGGGVFINGNSPTIRNCTFVDNYALAGGAIAVLGNGAPTIEACTFSGNWGNNGGVAYTQGSATFNRCLFTGTHTVFSGGALYVTGNSQPTVQNCIFSGNYSEFDGAIRVDGQTVTNTVKVVNCTLSGNEAVYTGALYARGSGAKPSVINTVFWKNNATDAGGIDEITNDESKPGVVTVTYSDVSGGFLGAGNFNSDPQYLTAIGSTWSSVQSYQASKRQTTLNRSGAGWAANQWAGMVLNPDTNQWRRFTIVSNTSTSLTVWGNATLAATAGEPFLIAGFDIGASSPCFDTGTATGAPNRDYANRPRPNGAGYDVGAYEYQPLAGLGLKLIVY